MNTGAGTDRSHTAAKGRRINTSSHLMQAFMLLGLVVAGMIIYSNTLHSPFVLDDRPYVLNDYACHINRLTPDTIANAACFGKPANRLIPKIGRVVPNVSFALNHYFDRYDLVGYHAANIGFHLLAGIFLFFFIKNTLILHYSLNRRDQSSPEVYVPDRNPELIAFFSAMIWLAHPVATESVTYICQRMTSIAAIFYILSLMLYVKGRLNIRSDGSKRTSSLIYFAGCFISGILAVTSKENTATLPLFILLYEWFFFQNLKIFRSKKQILWMTGAAIIFIGIAMEYLGKSLLQKIFVDYSIRDFTLPQRVLTEFRVIVYYVSLFLWPSPSRLNLDHHYPLSYSFINPWTTAISILVVIAMLFLAIYSAKKDRLLSFCILWFLGNLAIESSVIGIEIIFEHRTYLPFMMPCLLLTVAVMRYIRHRQIAFILLCGIIAIASIWTYQRNITWKDNISILEDCVRKSPSKIRPRQNLATDLLIQGKTSEAIDHFLEILKLDPAYISAYNNLGNILVQQNHIEKAVDYYIAALEVVPATKSFRYHITDVASVHLNLGIVLFHRQMFEEAEFHFRQGLKIEPDNAEAHDQFGIFLMNMKKFSEAEEQFNLALRLNPENTTAKRLLNQIETNKDKNVDENRNNILSLKLHSENETLYLRLGDLYKHKGIYDWAIKEYQKTMQINPENARAEFNLNACRELQLKLQEYIIIK